MSSLCNNQEPYHGHIRHGLKPKTPQLTLWDCPRTEMISNYKKSISLPTDTVKKKKRFRRHRVSLSGPRASRKGGQMYTPTLSATRRRKWRAATYQPACAAVDPHIAALTAAQFSILSGILPVAASRGGSTTIDQESPCSPTVPAARLQPPPSPAAMADGPISPADRALRQPLRRRPGSPRPSCRCWRAIWNHPKFERKILPRMVRYTNPQTY